MVLSFPCSFTTKNNGPGKTGSLWIFADDAVNVKFRPSKISQNPSQVVICFTVTSLQDTESKEVGRASI